MGFFLLRGLQMVIDSEISKYETLSDDNIQILLCGASLSFGFINPNDPLTIDLNEEYKPLYIDQPCLLVQGFLLGLYEYQQLVV